MKTTFFLTLFLMCGSLYADNVDITYGKDARDAQFDLKEFSVSILIGYSFAELTDRYDPNKNEVRPTRQEKKLFNSFVAGCATELVFMIIDSNVNGSRNINMANIVGGLIGGGINCVVYF